MKKVALVLIYLMLLGGCRQAVLTPQHPQLTPPNTEHPANPVEVSNPTTPKGEPTRLVRAYVKVNGREMNLTEYSPNPVVALEAEVLLEFSSPIDPNSLAGSQLSVDNSNSNRLKATLSPSDTILHIPKSLRDKQGRAVTVPCWNYSLNRTEYALIYACLYKYPEVELKPWSGLTLSPGEVLRLEFAGAVDQQLVSQTLSSSVYKSVQDENGDYRRESPALTLQWVDNNMLLFSIDEEINTVIEVSTAELKHHHYDLVWSLFMVPHRSLVVLDNNRTVLTQISLPLSTMGPIGMTDNYSRVHLARAAMWNPMQYGCGEYILDVASANISFLQDVYPAHGPSDYALLIAMRDKYNMDKKLQSTAYLSGPSNDGRRVASYYSRGEVVITILSTGEEHRYPVQSRLDDPTGGYYRYDPLRWSFDDSKLFYSGFSEIHESGVFVLDLKTGEERVLAENHQILHSSPYSPHLFTVKQINGGSEFYILDYNGNQVLLNSYGGRVVLTKWVDSNRAIINTSTSSTYDCFFPHSKCYIYHLDNNHWEYMAEGYGFDYDEATGRVFLLQDN